MAVAQAQCPNSVGTLVRENWCRNAAEKSKFIRIAERISRSARL
jgi:hypothetical protein